MIRQRAAWGAMILALGLGIAVAQDTKVPQSRSGKAAGSPAAKTDPAGSNKDIAAIRALTDAFIKAYKAKDAQALGALFTSGAEMEDENGELTSGRSAIVERFKQLFAGNEGGELKVATEAVRFLSPEVAVEQGTATVSGVRGAQPESNRYSVIYVKQDGHWLHARIRDEAPSETSHHVQLKQLEWLIGEWVNESDDAVVSTTCTWSDDGSFLLRRFDVKIEGQISLKGTQRIGWDPLQKQFRTWVFDSEGGFGEGLMARDGDRWVVKASGVRSDGQPASATNIITVLGKDRLGWQTADRTIAGVAVPDIDQFVMVRKPPQPGK